MIISIRAYRETIEVPIWQNRDRHSAYYSIKATTKFSREFNDYLPFPQLQERISKNNSLENFVAMISLKTCNDASFVVRAPYTDLKYVSFDRIMRTFMSV